MKIELENGSVIEGVPTDNVSRGKSSKRVIKKSKFDNLTEQDWKESNESSKENAGITGLTYEDIFR